MFGPFRFSVPLSLVSLFLTALLLAGSAAWAGPNIKILDNPIRMRFSSFSTSAGHAGRRDGRWHPGLSRWRV